ncbi:hypothetical protein BX666DRAFT_1037864 [Dichotomocladium elegans]|nr:hypothetical protein BX666DRAFT_1037864 [Dichotomocladium elegans]
MDKVKEYLHRSAEQDFGPAQADLGILLFMEKAYEKALQWLERAEQSQDPRALYHLGYMYETREGITDTVSTTISNERAIYCFKAAAERSNVLAQYRLGMHYCDGSLGLQRDPVKAMHFFRQAAHLGYPPAQRRLGVMYLEGLNIPSAIYHAQIQQQKDDGIARAWIEKAAFEGRDGQAYVLLGECYEKGRGIKDGANMSKALECYWQAAQIKGPHQINGFYAHAALLVSQGRYQEAYPSYVSASKLADQKLSTTLIADDLGVSAHRRRTAIGRLAQLMVARYSLHGWAGVPVDESRAFKILQQLANHDKEVGDEVDYWLAWCYDNDKGIDGECLDRKAMAFKYYLKAAKGDDVDSQAQVGKMFTRGIGTAENLNEAVTWYRKAAKKGHAAATYTLGILSIYHLHDIDKAIKYLERAIELGHIVAIDRLVELYQKLRAHPIAAPPAINGCSNMGSSSDMTRHISRANTILAIITRAAEKGNNPVAQRELGRLYSSAIGNPEDHQKAFNLFSKAASQNDGIATVMLGNFYEHGRSVAQDTDRALALYRKAISFGTETAFFAAAKLLHEREQFEEAYRCYTLAAENSKLRHTTTGKQARLMVARYILYNHVAAAANTKEEAFGALYALAAEEAFSPAYFWLGDCYHHGRGTAVDLLQAVRWYTDAAKEADNVEAMVRLASVFDHGVEGVVAPDDHLAFQYYSNAVRHGNAEAQYYLGMAYWRGRYDLPIDEVKATELFTESAQKGFGPSHWALGEMSYEKGFEDLALGSWDNGVKLGDHRSMRSLAQLLMTLLPKVTDDQDRQKQYGLAIMLFTDAANQGDAKSDLYLGRIFSSEAKDHQHKHRLLTERIMGDDEEEDDDDDYDEAQHDLQLVHYNLQKDKEEAAKFHLERAAAAGLVEAMYHAGEIWYEQGDFETAYPFYKEAAERGHTLARVMVARYKLSIPLPGLEVDLEGGFRELLDCAEQEECTLAYYSLGQCYELGLGTTANDDEALKWYHRSYEATTDPEAAFQIGSIEDRLGRHDHAATWYQLACRFSDHARAHYELGCYYLHNTASPHLEDAIRHLECAARQNDPDAMHKLGSLLLLDNKGIFGVEQQKRGLLWLEKAAVRCDHLPSLVLLGELYRTGKDYYPTTTDAMGLDTDRMVTVVPVQLDRAFDLFCQAAELGDMTAMLHVGTFYEYGLTMPVNVNEAKAWYELAQGAGAGWAAQFALARLLHRHFEDERLRAYYLFQSAAACAKTDEERRESKIYLYRYHLFGYHGGETDEQKQKTAMGMLLRYARHGEASVYYDVARAYEEGLGVPRPDLNLALEWYAHLERLANVLSPEQEKSLDRDLRQNITDALERLASIYRQKLAGTATLLARAEALEECAILGREHP